MRLLAITFLAFVHLHVRPTLASDFQDAFPNPESFDETARICETHYSFWSNESKVFEDIVGEVKTLTSFESKVGTDVVILASERSKRLIVSFRGTDGEEEDFVTDLDYKLTPFRDPSGSRQAVDGRVHQGFRNALFGSDNLYQDVDSAIKDAAMQFPDYEVTLVGHSLGAALAILYGAHVAQNIFIDDNLFANQKKVMVQTIGSPRVGDRTFKESVRGLENLAIWRLVYNDDAVPRIPLRVQGYNHVGHLILLRGNETRAFYQQSGSKEYASVPDRLWLFDKDMGHLLIPIFDHLPWSYKKGIDKAIQNGWWPDKFVPKEKRSCCVRIIRCWKYCS